MSHALIILPQGTKCKGYLSVECNDDGYCSFFWSSFPGYRLSVPRETDMPFNYRVLGHA